MEEKTYQKKEFKSKKLLWCHRFGFRPSYWPRRLSTSFCNRDRSARASAALEGIKADAGFFTRSSPVGRVSSILLRLAPPVRLGGGGGGGMTGDDWLVGVRGIRLLGNMDAASAR